MPDIAPPVTRPVRLHNYLAYGSNDVLGAGSMAVISGWVLIFYTQFCGLSAGQAATIFAVARILDAFASPMIGYISDHFGGTWLGQRFGRRRFFILAAIPLLPSFALMWLPGQGFWYYLVSYVLFELVYAMEIIPFETLAAEMSSDYRTKAKFAGSRILFGQASAILAGFLPLWLIEALGRDSADTFFYMGIIFAILFMATAGLLYAFSWERHLPAEAAAAARAGPRAAGGPGQALKALYRNLFSTMRIRAFRLHLGMYLGGYISQDIFNAAFTFFVIFALAGSTAIASGLLGTMYIVQFVAVIIAINLALRASPSRAYQVAAVSLWPGIVLTERVMPAVESGQLPPEYAALKDGFESQEYAGRIIDALFQAPDLHQRSGRSWYTAELGQIYDVQDRDGNIPASYRHILGGPAEPSEAEIM